MFRASNGIEIAFDPTSARRARELVVDFVTEGETGFKRQPQGAEGVQDMSVEELARRLEDDADGSCCTTCAPTRSEIASIPGATLLDEALTALEAEDRGTPIALHCHHGGGAPGGAGLIDLGFQEVITSSGGSTPGRSRSTPPSRVTDPGSLTATGLARGPRPHGDGVLEALEVDDEALQADPLDHVDEPAPGHEAGRQVNRLA